MKKILLLLLSFLLLFWLNLKVDSYTIPKSISWQWQVIQQDSPKNPYCSDGNCDLEKWIDLAKNQIKWVEKDKTASTYVQDIVLYVLWFLFFITVLIIIWAWVIILTSAWNDDKVENAKKIIINCVIWIILIFLAYPITSFVVWLFDKGKTSTTQNSKP